MLKLGSLFDGAGGFPLAAVMCGIEPVWASEIEPFPIAVTRKQFPNMKHLGDVSKVNGAEIEPVDIITFGSPCQDLSVAGKRAGLEGERSGLFMEAIRIIKEMRRSTNGRYPTIAVWENVPGAFSSAKGEDFRAVLEAFCRVKDDNAVVPRPPQGKWADAGAIMGDGYSVAWRVLDAQFWGVAQRRRRVFLVADFAEECSGKVLFERGGLFGNFAACWSARQGTAGTAEEGAHPAGKSIGIDHVLISGGTTFQGRGWYDEVSGCLKTQPHGVCAYDGYNAALTGEQSSTLGVNCGISTGRNGVMCVRERCGCEGGGKGLLIQDDKSGTIATSNDQFLCLNDQGGGVMSVTNDKTATLRAQEHGHAPVIAFDRATYNQGQNAQFDMGIDDSGTAHTVIAKGPGGGCAIL